MTIKQFKHWLFELDEQELCNSRDKIMEFVETHNKSKKDASRQRKLAKMAEVKVATGDSTPLKNKICAKCRKEINQDMVLCKSKGKNWHALCAPKKKRYFVGAYDRQTKEVKRKTWAKGFLDGLTYCVELTARWGQEGAAELILNESGMRDKIIASSKKHNPEIYEEVKEALSL